MSDGERSSPCMQSLPDTKVGTFTQALYNEAKKRLDGDQHEE